MRYVSSLVIEIFLAVMQHHLLWLVFVTYLSFFNKCESKQPQEENGMPYILYKLFRNRNKPPVLLYFDPRPNDRSIEEDPEHLRQYDRSIEEDPENLRQYDRSTEEDPQDWRERFRSMEENRNVFRDEDEKDDDSYENYLRTSKSDERAYLLYHLLRTTLEEEEVDPRTVQRLQPAKEFLRNAFIGRCKKLNKCRNQCPKKTIKLTCTMQCKQTFDDLDECDEPKENKCGVSKCGHTMPPSWDL